MHLVSCVDELRFGIPHVVSNVVSEIVRSVVWASDNGALVPSLQPYPLLSFCKKPVVTRCSFPRLISCSNRVSHNYINHSNGNSKRASHQQCNKRWPAWLLRDNLRLVLDRQRGSSRTLMIISSCLCTFIVREKWFV